MILTERYFVAHVSAPQIWTGQWTVTSSSD